MTVRQQDQSSWFPYLIISGVTDSREGFVIVSFVAETPTKQNYLKIPTKVVKKKNVNF